MRQQKIEGRKVTQKAETERHKKLVAQINSIIERARDSTLMDAEYDARLIEDFFKCGPIEVTLPENAWEESDQRGLNHDRWFVVDIYIKNVKESLKRQGLLVVTNGS